MNYTINSDRLQVVISDRGAELQSVKMDGTEYLWQGDPAIWPDRALTIFPYVARLTEETYLYQGKKYHLPIHGFAPTATFQVTQSGPDEITMFLTETEEFLEMYPFRFRFSETFKVTENTLSVTFRVDNNDEKTMYFGLGGHPGLNVPLSPGENFEDYSLHFHEACTPQRIITSPDVFWTGETVPYPLENGTDLRLSHSLFDDDAIVLRDMAQAVSLRDKTGRDRVVMEFPGFSFLGIWHMPKTEAPYVCIEPWTSMFARKGIIEDFEKQPDLIRLAPGDTYSAAFKMTLQ